MTPRHGSGALPAHVGIMSVMALKCCYIPCTEKWHKMGSSPADRCHFLTLQVKPCWSEVFCSHTEKGLWVRKQLSSFQVIRFRHFGFSGSLNIDSADRQPSTQNVALASSSCMNITPNDFLSSKQRAIGQEMSDCLQMLFGAKWKGVKAEVMLDEETAALQHTLRH